MKYGKGALLRFCFLVAAVCVSAQSPGVEADSSRATAGHGPVFRIPGPKVESSEGQPENNAVPASPYIKGSPRFLTLRKSNAGLNAAATSTSDATTLARGEQHTRMPSWEGSFRVLGATFPFAMIGTDPTKGSATTRIPAVLVPLQMSFPDGTQLSASQTACGDTRSPLKRALASPLFNNFAYHVGATFVGNTQYIDAYQRANFWSDVSIKAPDYHVLMSVAVAPVQAVTPDVSALTVQGPCAPIAAVDLNFFDAQIQNLIIKLQIPANILPVFLLYNTFETQGGCCVLGYHSITGQTVGRNNHPYIVAAYTDPGIFTKPIDDIHALSHEFGEWLADPFTTNFIPAWGNVGQEVGCSFFLETGDPVTGVAFEVSMNGFTYHPEDLVFLSWFARETPSRSVNGWYTFLNTFPAAQPVCQP